MRPQLEAKKEKKEGLPKHLAPILISLAASSTITVAAGDGYTRSSITLFPLTEPTSGI
jgi:hypothetical protein